MGGVAVSLTNGGLGGTVQTNDGIMGMVLTGAIDDGGYVLGTPILITRLAGLATAGITKDGNAFAYKQVKEYYDAAGDGAQLYLMLVENSQTVEDMADTTNADGVRKLLDYAKGPIKCLGIMSDDDSVTVASTAAGINDAVFAAATKMKVTAEAYFAAQAPFRCVIGGTSYGGDTAALTDNTNDSNPRCGILIGDTEAGKGAALGLLLGKLAVLPVQRKIGRVRNGSLPILELYLGADAYEDMPGDAALISAKGYITFTTYADEAGYFFAPDLMMTSPTDDYALLCRGRIIDKMHRIGYKTLLKEVEDEVPTIAGGLPDELYASNLERTMLAQINTTMVAAGELDEAICSVPLNQNVTSTNTVQVVLKGRPKGYATFIELSLGYTL